MAAALDLDVAGGEQDCFLWQWRRMVELRAVDVVQPDVCYVGGFTRALAVAAHGRRRGPAVRAPLGQPLARDGVRAAPHVRDPERRAATSSCSIEGPDYYPWQYDLFDPPIAVRDGRLPAPAGARLGRRAEPALAGRGDPSARADL